MRLNKFLASAGLGSRRGCEQLIREGRVTINGKVCQNFATQVEPVDAVKASGRLVHVERPLHFVLHKPRGYLCTASDTEGRRTIFELLPRNWPRLFHVGRLDKESEGLIILTNDGELSLRLTHPRYKIDKEYDVAIDRPFDPADRDKLLEGIHIEGGRARAESVTRVGPKHLRLILRQGIKRQIRLMLYKLGYEVEALCRIRIGPLSIAGLRPGESRALKAREVAELMGERPAPAPGARDGTPRRSAQHTETAADLHVKETRAAQ